MISVTFPDMSGRLLSGQTPAAFWNSVAHAEPLIVGVNCGRRFKEIRPFVEELANNANCYLSGHFNAGLPNAFGEYDETPDDMFDDLNPEIKDKTWEGNLFVDRKGDYENQNKWNPADVEVLQGHVMDASITKGYIGLVPEWKNGHEANVKMVKAPTVNGQQLYEEEE